jgi:outer membrane protein
MNRSVMVWMVAAGLIAGFGASRAGAADQRIVFVNLDRAFNEFYKTKRADAQLKQQADEFNDERKKMVTEFETLQESFNTVRDEAQNTALSEEVRSQKRSEAEEKLVELREFDSKLRRFDESRRKQLDDQSRRMRKRIVEEIREAIQTYARGQSYEAVVDSSGQSMNGVEVVVFTDVKTDITDDVLDILNKGKPDTAASESPAGPQ